MTSAQSEGSTTKRAAPTTRVDGLDWAALTAELNTSGCAQTQQVLVPGECASISALYDEAERFRSTIDMARYRYGSGQYRYFDHPLPALVGQLREAFYPHLLPIARDWATKLGKPAPWPDTLTEWLDRCHQAGQTKPTAILLRYRQGDWNALHRDLYGDLVSSSPPANARCSPSGGGRPHRCATASAPCGQEAGTRWGWFFTTPPEACAAPWRSRAVAEGPDLLP